MANEYLQRTPTSTGNRRVWTFSYWIKKNSLGSAVSFYTTQASTPYLSVGEFYSTDEIQVCRNESATVTEVVTKNKFRDVSSWMHILIIWDTTHIISSNRAKLFVNGVEQKDFQNGSGSSAVFPTQNYEGGVNRTVEHDIGTVVTGAYPNGYPGTFVKGEMTDVFLVDGQALTPDVFGFNKQGKGYISVGSTQATDFRPGQWVPKTPRVIKTEINRRGGFGVNGFYLPMNDYRNFGADFHGDPNSIITLNEKLPQPRVGVASTASVGLGYTDALRADPYAANLVLALPFVSGGLSSGFGDYSAAIRGSGTPKTMSSGSVSIASTASYYGSSANFQNSNSYVDTPGTSGDFNMGTGDFTIEGWFYPTGNGGNARLFGQNTNTYNAWDVYIDGSSATGQLYMMGAAYQLTTASIRGNQWNHVAISRKNLVWTTYLNGVAAGIVTSIVNNTVGDSTNKFRVGAIGENAYGGVGYSFQGYIQDFRVYKGVAKYTGGFDVPRPYTPVGIATWRQVPDTTANNFATLNPLGEKQSQKGTITTGNLRYDGVLNTFPEITSTVGVSTGKWYYEVYTGTVGNGSDSHFLGISNRSANSNGTLNIYPSTSSGGTRPTIGIANRFSTQLAFYDQTGVSDISGTSGWWADGSVVGFAFDVNNNSVSVYKNGVLGFTSFVSLSYVATGIGSTVGQGVWSPCFSFESSASRTPASNWVMNFGQNPTFSGNTTAGTFTDSNGKGLFKYQPPSGFLALCEDNLPTPAISDPGKHFKTVLYTGDSAASRSIVGVGFTPDLVWLKDRSSANNAQIFDSVRGFGGNKELTPSETYAEGGGSSSIYGFVGSAGDNSFSYLTGSSNPNQANYSGNSIVAWCWRAGAGTTSINTNGSITSVVSVNQDAGFSIVSYTGNGTSGATVGHGLGKAPKFILIKRRSGASNWAVAGSILGANSTLYLNLTNATDTYGDTNLIRNIQTSTTFELGTDTNRNQSNGTHIAYCWAEIENFSKFGSYVGNGNADGPFVYCGFKPAFVIIKRTAGAADWVIHDSSRTSTNPSDTILRPNTSSAELTASTLNVDFLSNGFKIRNVNASYNNAETYIFAAFAESPFQTANSK